MTRHFRTDKEWQPRAMRLEAICANLSGRRRADPLPADGSSEPDRFGAYSVSDAFEQDLLDALFSNWDFDTAGGLVGLPPSRPVASAGTQQAPVSRYRLTAAERLAAVACG